MGNDGTKAELESIINNFNPRSRVGNDEIADYYIYLCMISIHVPAWGTTKDI